MVVALKHDVGIEIDHESTKGNDVEGLKAFTKGFRQNCTMGKVLLSMDVMGGPGGAGLFWIPEAVKALVPAEGYPGHPPKTPEDGDKLDFVNLMVIDACQDAECLIGFWSQWPTYGGLNLQRATMSFAGRSICMNEDKGKMVRTAWEWAKKQNAFGLRAWSVAPHGGGDWDEDWEEAGRGGGTGEGERRQRP